MPFEWDFNVIFAYWPSWVHGALITFAYAVGTILGGLLIGVVLGTAVLSRYRVIGWVIDAYVQVFRCTPLLVQIVWFYYALPILLGINLSAWIAAGIGLSLYMGAFSTEIFRAGVMSIDKGQWQAARALGMTEFQMMRRTILPQATRRMIPPFVNQSVLQLKNTSLLYVVAVPDLMYTSSVLVSQTYRPLEIYTSVAIMYFVMLWPLVKLASRLETRVDA